MLRALTKLIAVLFIALTMNTMGASLGIEGGLSLAQNAIVPNTGMTFAAKNGLAGGIFLDLPLASWVSIGPEVLYVQKGTKMNILTIDAQYEFDYVDVPLLLKFKLGSQSVSFTVFGGVAYGFLMSAKASALGQSTDVKDQLTKNDLSVHAGAALGFNLGKSTEFFVSGRYILGLQDIDNDGDLSDTTKNNAIVALGGLKFNLGGKN